MSKYLGHLPVLPVKNLLQTIVFYKDFLGFDNEWFWEDSDAGISRDETHLLFTQNEDYVTLLNTSDRCFELMWFVDGIEDIYEEYQKKEIPFELQLTERSWGLKEFSFKDINGYLIKVTEHKQEAE